jgi:hypothetical protein
MFKVHKALAKSLCSGILRAVKFASLGNNLKKGALGSLLFCLLSCTQDYQVSDNQDVRVVVDSYVQTDRLEELDVLVVLDTSGSMSDNYDDIADGMDILRSDIESLTLDYRFGYITMDPTNLSYVGPFDVSSSAIDMLMAPSLLPMTILEEGFSATYNFFNSEDGLSFRRPEADFLLFLISDEDEQSAITASLFYDWTHSEFKEVNHDTVCVINPDDESQQDSWQNEIGYKYIELSDLYGKGTIDLQSSGWSAWLSDSSYLTQRKDYITLSEHNPILESIIVYIDQNAEYGWTYVKDTNTIHLDVIPDYSSVVEVGYNVYID